MGDLGKLTDKQELFVVWYVRLLYATRAAERAGYTGNDNTLRVTGCETLANPNVRAAIDAQLAASIPSAQEVLARVSQRAHTDIGAYYDDDGNLDLERMKSDGVSHLVKGANVGKDGVSWSLTDPQTATKTLARYHKLLGSDVQVDVNTTLTADADTLAALAAQIGIVQASISTEQDDTDDSTP